MPLAPFVVNQGLLFLIGLAMLQALFALSWNLMFSYAGLGSFGHAMFYGVGAYAVAAIIFHGLPIPFLAGVLLATLLGAISAFVIGSIVLPAGDGNPARSSDPGAVPARAAARAATPTSLGAMTDFQD